MKYSVWQVIGAVGVLTCLGLFIYEPSFPTPDKLLVFVTFLFMVFHQAIDMLKRILPFVAVILTYESFRGIAHSLNTHVNYALAPDVDKFLFGNLPTIYFQNWLWHGHVRWYDYALYLPYLLFFALPFGLAILVWKTRVKHYWNVITSYTITFFGAFLCFLVFPAAPPWMASDQHRIEHIQRISSDVWRSLGIHDFPLLYDHIAPNPVAAVPSLHAACSTLFSIYVFKLYGRRWGALSMLYPAMIYFGVIYQGEHYAFDVFVGVLLAIGAYLATPWVMAQSHRLAVRTAAHFNSLKKRTMNL